jgi:hypothetical protein
MNNLLKRVCVLIYIPVFTLFCFAQEIVLSPREQYYDFLSLDGTVSREFLNYRTMSDSLWTMTNPDHDIWKHDDTVFTISDTIRARPYGPYLYTSWNSSAPYGVNDRALWQGKGVNALFSAGVQLSGYGFSAVLKPDLVFSQNSDFTIITPAYSGETYADKAAKWGYYGIPSIDAPQRFGNSMFWDYSWGDSEIRYSWKSFTIGFGTQSIWLGPAKINPLLHSNNAVPYPKLDIGLRKQQIRFFDRYFGDLELRSWWGRTEESDFFDSISDNDYNLITGLSISFAPSFAPDLAFGFHRTMLSDWEDMDYTSILTLLWPLMENSAGKDERDQRASLTVSWMIPRAQAELYVEWARNDFSPSLDHVIRYPFHTQAYTVGGQKSFTTPFLPNNRHRIILEIANIESSRDYIFLWPTTFYAHHIIKQGYTNGGQWIGAGIGTGGNSQYIALETFYEKGSTRVFFQRVNPDNDYVWFMDFNSPHEVIKLHEQKIRADLSLGIQGNYFISDMLQLSYSAVVTDSHNYNYENNSSSIHRYNIHLATGLTFSF